MNRLLCVSHHSTVIICQADASRSFVGRAVKYDTIEVSMYTVFLSVAIRFRSELKLSLPLRLNTAAGGYVVA